MGENEARKEPVLGDAWKSDVAHAQDRSQPLTEGWLYAEGANRIGPLTSAQIEELIQAGTIPQDTMFWREGRLTWMPLHQIPELSNGRVAPPAAAEEISFLRSRPNDSPVGLPLWGTAFLLGISLIGFALTFHLPEKATLPYALGVGFGALLVPAIAVGLSSLWGDGPSKRKSLKVFVGTSLVLLTASSATVLTERGYAQRWLNKANMTAEDFKAQAVKCARVGDLRCQEGSLREFIRLQPDDAVAVARLGIVLNERGKHDEAIAQLKRSQELGAGTYDLFAYLADSHEKLGNTGEAIEWSYKALSVVPTLIDVRGKLARLLVRAERPYEALSLLQSYDYQLEARGLKPYFVAQRISIETQLDQTTSGKATEKMALRLPTYAGHFFVPVTLGTAKPKPFMVDTGASMTSLSESMLHESVAKYRVVDSQVQMRTADGRKIVAKGILIDSLKIGPFELRNVPAAVCADCASLLGQASLSKFDMQSTRIQGVEFLLLSPRDTQ